MATKIYSPLITEDVDNCRFVRIVSPFVFWSEVLQCLVVVPSGFVYDYESVPLVRGTNKRGGTAHDYLCRKDSRPVVDKATAAAVYREIMDHCYALEERGIWARVRDWSRSWLKWAVVRVAPGYFHKFKVSATYEEIKKGG
jgi:hypothetical protein